MTIFYATIFDMKNSINHDKYSRFNPDELKRIKKWKSIFPKNVFADRLCHVMQCSEALRSSNSVESEEYLAYKLSVMSFELILFQTVAYSYHTHYFISDDLEEYLADFVARGSYYCYSGVPEFPMPRAVFPAKFEPNIAGVNLKTDSFFSIFKNKGFFVHFHNKTGLKSLYVNNASVVADFETVYITDGSVHALLPCDVEVMRLWSDVDAGHVGFPYCKYIMGLSMYIKKNPNAIKPCYENPSLKTPKGGKLLVAKNEDTVKIFQGMRMPHYRRPHFRELKSSWYKNKKGVKIAVKGSFINGDGFDVFNGDVAA